MIILSKCFRDLGFVILGYKRVRRAGGVDGGSGEDGGGRRGIRGIFVCVDYLTTTACQEDDDAVEVI